MKLVIGLTSVTFGVILILPVKRITVTRDDNVSDTPNSKGWTFCNLEGESCGSLDNVQNYMEYSYCCKMFTEGQKSRMRTAALSSVAQRNQLSTSSNLIATGVEGDIILCESRFTVDELVICEGDSILFTDESYHGVNTWEWDFADGTVFSGSEEGVHNVTYHTFNTGGVFEVILTVGNENFTSYILSKNNYGASGWSYG